MCGRLATYMWSHEASYQIAHWCGQFQLSVEQGKTTCIVQRRIDIPSRRALMRDDFPEPVAISVENQPWFRASQSALLTLNKEGYWPPHIATRVCGSLHCLQLKRKGWLVRSSTVGCCVTSSNTHLAMTRSHSLRRVTSPRARRSLIAVRISCKTDKCSDQSFKQGGGSMNPLKTSSGIPGLKSRISSKSGSTFTDISISSLTIVIDSRLVCNRFWKQYSWARKLSMSCLGA